MKKNILIVILISLVLLELVICTGFQPFAWQRAVSERLPRMFSESPNDCHA